VPPLADDEVAKFDCGICLETLPILDLFHGMQCDHKFCAQCMATYIEGRIRDGGVSILCPSCKIVVERIMGCDTMHCRYIYWTLLAFYFLSRFLLVFNPHSDLLYSITNS